MTRNLVSLIALLAATPSLATADTHETIVVTVSRSGDAIPASLIGSSVTVVDSLALEKRQTRVVSDVLRDVPGVAVSRSGAVGGVTQVRIRGSEQNHVLVFVDGIKAGDAYYGEYDFGTLIADESARVEVLRGQQSALYGSDAIGGVISYTTLSGREAPGISARAEAGSFGTLSTAARIAGVTTDAFDYAVSATYLESDGYPTAPAGRRDIGSESLGTSAKFNWTPADNFRVTAVGRYNYTKADINDQGIDDASPVVQGYPVITVIDTPDNNYSNKAFYGLLRAELSLFDDSVTTALSGQIADTNRDTFNAYGYGYGHRGRRYRGSFENSVRFGNERVRNRFTFAIDGEREEFRNVDPGGFSYTGTNRIDTLGFVAQYDVVIDERLALGASARIDINDRFRDASTVRMSASYLAATGTRVHAAYGSGVKAPTASELFGYFDGQYIGNPDLQPERSQGWEAGVEQTLLDGGLTLGATYFRNRFVDPIQTVGTFFNGEYISTSINSDNVAKQHGVEAYVAARLGDWRLDASYTYLDAPQIVTVLLGEAPGDGSFHEMAPVERQALRRPKRMASLNLGYQPRALPVSAMLTVRHNGRQQDFAFNSIYQQLLVDLKPFTIVNLAATFDLTPGIQLYGRVENLFDENYQEVFTYRAPGRAAYGGVRVRF